MEIVYKKIEELIPYERNPRKISDEAVNVVKNSIRDFGFKIPIVIDKNNVVVCGHTRLKASKKLNLKKVPCVVADDLNEKEINAFRLADNKTSEFSIWDDAMLDVEIEDIDLNMEQYGFDLKKETTVIREDEIPEERETDIQIGDIYQLGKHRLLCGDALSQIDIDLLLDGDKCELTLTDPPYELITEGGVY